jgi:hypothetical protein
MPPALALGGLSALGNVAGGAIGASAASDAADAQIKAAREANKLQWDMYQQQRGDLEPWRQAGINSLYGMGGIFKRKDGGSGVLDNSAEVAANKTKFVDERFNKLRAERDQKLGGLTPQARKALSKSKQLADDKLRARAEKEWAVTPESQVKIASDQYELDPELFRNFTNADFQKDPGYDFRMQEGQKALERSAAARGGLQSGGTLKSLARYGQDYASNEFNNAYNRFNNDRSNRFNRLSSLAGVGQTANTQIGAAGQNYANQFGQNTMGAANAAGAAGIAGANAWGGALQGIGGAAMDLGWMDMWDKRNGGKGLFQSKSAANIDAGKRAAASYWD